MNVVHVRGMIVDHTRKLLRLYGIKRMRMDDVARELGMSKRTMYKLFASKDSLVGNCLDIFAKNGRELLQKYMSSEDCSPVYRSLATVNCYIMVLYQMGRVLLADLEMNTGYQSVMKRERDFWFEELLHSLEGFSFCPVVESTPEQMVENMLDLFYLNCRNGYSFTSQLWMAYLLVRGLAGDKEVVEISSMDKNVKREWKRLSAILQNWHKPASIHAKSGSQNSFPL